MSTVTRGEFKQALKPIINTWFGDLALKEIDRIYPKYFEVVKTNDAYEVDTSTVGSGLARHKPEGAAGSYDDVRAFYTKRYDVLTYTNGLVLTYELVQDAKAPAKARDMVMDLRRKMEKTRDILAANTLNRAFNSTYTGGDGKELCATDHPTLAADVANELATSADLSEASLEQSMIDLRDMKDNRGISASVKARKLVIPTALQFEAHRILKSVARVGVADNDANALKDMGMIPEGIVVNEHLTDTDAFFIITDAKAGLRFIEREAPRIMEDNDFDTLNAKYLGIMRQAVGWSDYKGVFGSPGAA